MLWPAWTKELHALKYGTDSFYPVSGCFPTIVWTDHANNVRLDTLDLSDNKLSVFDANVEKWRRLMILDLSNNDLTYVSSRIGFIETLKHIGLKGNSKLVIPIHVVVQGTHAIKSYLRTVLRAHDALQKKIEIYNCKVASQPGASSAKRSTVARWLIITA